MPDIIQSRLARWRHAKDSLEAHRFVSRTINVLQIAALRSTPVHAHDVSPEKARATIIANHIEQILNGPDKAIAEKARARLRHPDMRRLRKYRPYEHPLQMSVLSDVTRSLVQSRKAFPTLHDKHIFISTLPSGKLNGRILRPREDIYLILVDEGLTTFLANFAAFATLAIPRIDGRINIDFAPADLGTHFAEHSGCILSALFQLLMEYAVRGTAVPLDKVGLQGGQRLKELIGGSALMFVIGHELTHVSLGHLLAAHPVERGILSTLTPNLALEERQAIVGAQEVEMNSWRDEFAADRFATDLILHAVEEDGSIDAFLGAWAFFTATDVLERTLAVLEPERKTTLMAGTHPAPFSRLSAILQQFPPSTYEGGGALRAIKELAKIVEMCWKHVEPEIRCEANKGTKIHPIWHAS